MVLLSLSKKLSNDMEYSSFNRTKVNLTGGPKNKAIQRNDHFTTFLKTAPAYGSLKGINT